MNLQTPNILPNCSVIFTILRGGTNVKRLSGSHERCINKTIKRLFQVADLFVPNIGIVFWIVLITNAVSRQQISIDILLQSLSSQAFIKQTEYIELSVPCHVANIYTFCQAFNVFECFQVIAFDCFVWFRCDCRDIWATPSSFSELFTLFSAKMYISFIIKLFVKCWYEYDI